MTVMRSIGLPSRKPSTEPVPNTTGSFGLKTVMPPGGSSPAVIVLSCSATAACFWLRLKEYSPVSGISTATVTINTLTTKDWTTNQSCRRAATLFRVGHKSGEGCSLAAGSGVGCVADKSDMVVLLDGNTLAAFLAKTGLPGY